jgi:hypothetical protein
MNSGQVWNEIKELYESMLENTEGAIKHGQSRETGNIGVHKKINKTKTQYNMCWTPLYENKHKKRK